MRRSYAKKIDATHTAIKNYLEAHGVEVVDCSAAGSVPDLLCYDRRMGAGWVECKVPTKREVLFTWKQLDWISKTRFPVRIVDNKEDALEFAKTHEGMLTQEQKTSLTIYLMKNTKRLHTPNQVMEAMNGQFTR